MKNLFFLLAILFAVSCGKEYTSDKSEEEDDLCEFSAKINGEDFCSWYGGYFDYDPADGEIYLQSGIRALGILSFSIPNPRKGVITLDKDRNVAMFSDENGFYSIYYISQSGSITFEKLSTTEVKGTFDFTATGKDEETNTIRTIRVTNGRFFLQQE